MSEIITPCRKEITVPADKLEKMKKDLKVKKVFDKETGKFVFRIENCKWLSQDKEAQIGDTCPNCNTELVSIEGGVVTTVKK